MEVAIAESLDSPKKGSTVDLDKIKAEATANISSYLANIEVTKANMLAKIANEVEKVEVAKIHTQKDEYTEQKSSTYPKILIKKD